MTAFARDDIRSICIPVEAGGCGRVHERKVLNPKRKKNEIAVYDAEFGVNCQQCEPILLSPLHGWASNPAKVELTPDQIEEKERLEKEGNIATTAMARELGAQLAQVAREGLATPVTG